MISHMYAKPERQILDNNIVPVQKFIIKVLDEMNLDIF